MLQLLLKLPCVPFNVDVQCKKHVLRFLPRDGQYSRFSHCWVKKIVYQSSVEALWQCRPLSREIGDNTQKKETESSSNERKTELNFKFCPGDRNHPKFCYGSVNFVCPPGYDRALGTSFPSTMSPFSWRILSSPSALSL